MSEYSEKLRDPRWQKKRLEILNRDEFTCQLCGDKKTTLMVHHLQYEKGTDPWEYDNKVLITLCETCHQEEHELRPVQEQILLRALREERFFSDSLNVLAIGFHDVRKEHTPIDISCAIERTLSNEKLCNKMLDNYLISLKERKKEREKKQKNG